MQGSEEDELMDELSLCFDDNDEGFHEKYFDDYIYQPEDYYGVYIYRTPIKTTYNSDDNYDSTAEKLWREGKRLSNYIETGVRIEHKIDYVIKWEDEEDNEKTFRRKKHRSILYMNVEELRNLVKVSDKLVKEFDLIEKKRREEEIDEDEHAF